MRSDRKAFFGLEVDLPVILGGCEQKLKCLPTHDELGKFVRYSVHTVLGGVYDHFVIALLTNYPGLPDYRTLTTSEVRWLYTSLNGYLKRATAQTSDSS